MNYIYGEKEGHIPDKLIRDEEVRSVEVPLTGKKGTLALVDTNRVFHFGSSVASKERCIFLFQYMALTNFLQNPIAPILPPFIAKRLATSEHYQSIKPEFSPLERCVLLCRL